MIAAKCLPINRRLYIVFSYEQPQPKAQSSPNIDGALSHPCCLEIVMGRKAAAGEVNRSEAIRNLLRENPNIKGSEAISKLANQGITVKNSLFYLVKGKM